MFPQQDSSEDEYDFSGYGRTRRGWGDPSDYDEGSDGSYVVDIEAHPSEGRAKRLSPEGKIRRVYAELQSKLPQGIPVYKQLLYFQMIHAEEEVDLDDEEEDDIAAETLIRGYWMDESHIYVDVLDWNSKQFETNHIFMRVVCDGLVFLCVREEYVDMCVNVFWDEFKRLGLEVHLTEEDKLETISPDLIYSSGGLDEVEEDSDSGVMHTIPLDTSPTVSPAPKVLMTNGYHHAGGTRQRSTLQGPPTDQELMRNSEIGWSQKKDK